MAQSGRSGLTSRSRGAKQQTDNADIASKATSAPEFSATQQTDNADTATKAANDHQKGATQQTDIAPSATKAPNDQQTSVAQQTDIAPSATKAPNDHTLSASPSAKQQPDNADANTAKDSSAMTALFASPSIVEKAKAASRPKRPKVEVPEHVMAELRDAKANSDRRAWPLPSGITEELFKEMCNVFYSAADQLGGTATILLGRTIEGEKDAFDRVKELSEATHVRVSIGRRRGARKNGQKNGTSDSDK